MVGRPTVFDKPMTGAERSRRSRAARKAKPKPLPRQPGDPVKALGAWSRKVLKIPAGHPAAGKPMTLPDFAEAFLRDSWDAHESALCVARKNGKSAIVAVLILGFLVGPLRRAGWRGAVCSVSLGKAAELRSQVQAIAEASGLAEQLKIRRSPYPGRIESGTGSFETLSSDRTAGHASGFDLVAVDETGLFPERARELLNGLRSSVSAKGGRTVHLSIRGDSPLYGEILDNPETVKAVYAADPDCDLDDRAAWAAANPALGSIKSVEYMESEVRRIRGTPSDEPSFRAFDLNQSLDPVTEMIVGLAELKSCIGDAEPRGGCYLGFDFGEATSGTAAAAIWPETGLLRTWLAFGDKPGLLARGRADSANYLAMETRGELRTYPGRVVPIEWFLRDVAADLDGSRVLGAAGDSYKDSECKDALERADLHWPIEFRRIGAGKDGGRDVRLFQRLVHGRKLVFGENLSLVTAVSKASVVRDGNGNPGLRRSSKRSRIDVLSAAVIAAGLAAPRFDRRQRRVRLV